MITWAIYPCLCFKLFILTRSLPISAKDDISPCLTSDLTAFSPLRHKSLFLWLPAVWTTTRERGNNSQHQLSTFLAQKSSRSQLWQQDNCWKGQTTVMIPPDLCTHEEDTSVHWKVPGCRASVWTLLVRMTTGLGDWPGKTLSCAEVLSRQTCLFWFLKEMLTVFSCGG